MTDEPPFDIVLSLLALAESWDQRLWHEHGLTDSRFQQQFTDWHSRQIRELVHRYQESV